MPPTDPLTHHFFTLACNNAWANQRLLDSCTQLTDEQFAAPRSGFFPSLKATANHILTVDWFYVDAMERALRQQPPHENINGFFEPEQPYATCGELAEEQKTVDLRLIKLCRELSPSDLSTPVRIERSQGCSRDPLVRMLGHLFQHQIHHRGQMHAMLSSTETPPPALDEFFCVGDAEGRAEELARLGLSEQEIWG